MDNPGLLPETSNFYCLPGRAGGTLIVLGLDGRVAAVRYCGPGLARVCVNRIGKGLTSLPPGEQHDASRKEASGGRDDDGFEILGEAAVAIDPGKEALDDPTLRRQLETNLIGQLADNLHYNGCRIGDPLPGIDAVGAPS